MEDIPKIKPNGNYEENQIQDDLFYETEKENEKKYDDIYSNLKEKTNSKEEEKDITENENKFNNGII